MKPYLPCLLIFAAITAYARGATNLSAKTEDYINPGAPITVHTGQTFSIRIESNPTTGYGWQLAEKPGPIIIPVTNAYMPPDSALCGAGGHEVWKFKAVARGRAKISLKYVRPWEKEKPAKTEEFTVIVK